MEQQHRLILDDLTRPLRLDQALVHLLPERSRNFLARLIDEGRVRVDGKQVTKRSHRLEQARELEIDIPDPEPSRVEAQEFPLHILYQDEDLAVIEKPAGFVVHPAAGHRDATLVNALLFHLDSLSGIGGEIRPGIVHRLDKDTSGVMIVAKNDVAHRRLSEAWNTDQVRKEYLALVYGTPKAQRGTVEQPIGRDTRDRKRMAVSPTGRKARTDYEVVERLR